MNSYEIPGGDGYQPLDEASLDAWMSAHVWGKIDRGADRKAIRIIMNDGREMGFEGTNHEVETLMSKIRERGSV